MSLQMRVRVTILLVMFWCILISASQASLLVNPGIGTVNGLSVEVVKVTTNPTDPKDTVDCSGPVGGNNVSVYVKVQYGNNITNINSVTVNIHESGVTTSVGSLSLTSYTSLADSGSGDAIIHTRVYYTSGTSVWNTLTTTPMIYNANYCFMATIDYDLNNLHSSTVFESDEVSVAVKNLWINGSTYNRCYFLRNSGDTSPTSITINFDHYLYSASYTVEVTIRHTRENQTIIATLTTTTSSHNGTVTWTPDPISYPSGGYFCYNAKVIYGNDTAYLCSPTCFVMSDNLDFSNETTASFQYSLSEQPLNGSITAAFFEDLNPLGEVNNISEQSRSSINPVVLTISEEVNSCRVILSGKDNHFDNRGRNSQPILPANKGKGFVLYRCFKFVQNNESDSSFVVVHKKLDLDSNLWIINSTAEYSYQANSGRSMKHAEETAAYNYLNSDSIAAQRNEVNEEKTYFGSLPTYTHCSENIGRPYQVEMSMFRDRTENVWNDYIWRDSMQSQYFEYYFKGYNIHVPYYIEGQYVERRYRIYNASGTDTHTIVFPGKLNVTRTVFRLHEDSNHSFSGGSHKDAIKGTEGCIGVVPGSMKIIQPFIEQIKTEGGWKSTANNQTATTIPLYVFPSNDGVINEWIYRKVRN